jgi:hypothetical protein
MKRIDMNEIKKIKIICLFILWLIQLKKNIDKMIYLRAPLHLRTMESRKVFWGATKPRRDPGINALELV